MLTMHRLYVSKKKKKEDFVDALIQRPEDNIKKRRGRFITATRNNTNNTNINKTKIARKQKWEEKQQNVHFCQQASEISHEKTWTRLRKGNFKRET